MTGASFPQASDGLDRRPLMTLGWHRGALSHNSRTSFASDVGHPNRTPRRSNSMPAVCILDKQTGIQAWQVVGNVATGSALCASLAARLRGWARHQFGSPHGQLAIPR